LSLGLRVNFAHEIVQHVVENVRLIHERGLLRIQGFGFRVLGSGFWGFEVWVSGLWGFGFRVSGFGFRVQVLGVGLRVLRVRV